MEKTKYWCRTCKETFEVQSELLVFKIRCPKCSGNDYTTYLQHQLDIGEIAICSGCGAGYSATPEFWYKDKTTKNGFQSKCKECSKKNNHHTRNSKAGKEYQQKYQQNYQVKYEQTLVGHLRRVYTGFKHEAKHVETIDLCFTSDELVKFVTDPLPHGLGVISLSTLQHRHLRRKDNRGHYTLENLELKTRW